MVVCFAENIQTKCTDADDVAIVLAALNPCPLGAVVALGLSRNYSLNRLPSSIS